MLNISASETGITSKKSSHKLLNRHSILLSLSFALLPFAFCILFIFLFCYCLCYYCPITIIYLLLLLFTHLLFFHIFLLFVHIYYIICLSIFDLYKVNLLSPLPIFFSIIL